jgi:carboxyl-terminal processing protease
LEKWRFKIDDQIKARDFTFFNLSNELITKRIEYTSTLYEEFLKTPVKLDNKDKTINLDPEKIAFVDSKNALKERWCDYMTYSVFSEIYTKDIAQSKAKEKSDTVKIKTIAELDKDARERVLKNHKQWFKRMKEIDRNDRLAVYVNCLTELYDPHTNFYPPQDKEDFDIQMSGTLEGIGATLQQKDGYTSVTQIVPGSASWKQGQLKTGDVILKVAQNVQEPVSIVDMNLDEAVRLIRGPKGTEVRLTVRKIDGTEVIIPIIRDVVVLEETYAKSAVIDNKESNTKTGYLFLPKFYADFNNENGRRCAVDVKKEVLKLMADNVDGIVIDLRENGGGSLRDVVEIGGLFVKDGPIVQVKGRDNNPQVMSDYDPKIVYAGPLVIMIDQGSASASEILAAAMQDYKRAIIVGSESSYGKGTVQRFDELDRYISKEYASFLPLGSIKYTMQKFYRIDGGATQLKGVESDVVMPNHFSYIETGEREIEHAMPWDEISKASYTTYESYVGDFAKIIGNSKARIAKDTTFQLYDQQAKYYSKIREDLIYPLSYTAFKSKMDKEKKEASKFEDIHYDIKGIEVKGLSQDVKSWGSDTTKTAKFEEFSKKIRQDKYIYESSKIIEDIIRY